MLCSSSSSSQSPKMHLHLRPDPVVAVEHFNGALRSVLVYATRGGSIVGWDLRCRSSAFHLRADGAMGAVTSLSLGPESSGHAWLVAGTTRGYILVYDLRFQLLVAAWRHSGRDAAPIHRLAVCPEMNNLRRWRSGLKGPAAAPSSTTTRYGGSGSGGFTGGGGGGSGQGEWGGDYAPFYDDGASSGPGAAAAAAEGAPLVYVCAGNNECAVWDVQSGACRCVHVA